MENKETKSQEMLLIKGYEKKESKAGRQYFSFETDNGKYSVFEFDIADEIIKKLGTGKAFGEFEIAKRDNFKNIRKIIQWIDTEKISGKKELIKTEEKADNFAEARSLKDTSIYTSYAKDIFICLLEADKSESIKASALMKSAIDLVLQAKNSFK